MAGTIIADVVEDSSGNPFLQSDGASLNSTGYQKLSNGLIIQWGYLATGAGGNYTITFPIAFPSACLNIQTTFKNTAANLSSAVVVSYTTTTAQLYQNTSQSAQMWFAIGK